MTSRSAETASESRSRRGRAAAVTGRLAAFVTRHASTVAAAAAVLGGLLLLYAETLDLYRIVTPSGSISNAAGSVRTGSDQHSWALGVMGIAAAVAVVLALVTRQRLPALAATTLGLTALILALTWDLPDVTSSGLTTDREAGAADPGPGFWLELVGALLVTAGSASLAAIMRRARTRDTS
jgi:hypothetical protein